MVQSIGISVGNANSYVAACQGGGIEILLNEFSNRSTPSMVAFTDKTRTIGVEANSNLFMNLKNTVYDLIVLLGTPFKDVQPHRYPFKIEEAPDGGVLVVVTHLGNEMKFNMTQIMAMLLTKLRGIARGSLNCVLSCPQFYSDQQKSALLQAAMIAGLNPMQVISDMSAVALNYAYYRTTKEESDKFIAFINFGQSNLQCIVAWLTPKEDVVRILAAESEKIGGSDFDRLLADYFVETNKLSLNQKSYLKLVSACEKLKKNLSANSNEIPISVESLISEDKDFNARIERAKFEELSAGLFQKIELCLRNILENAKSNFDKIPKGDVPMAEGEENANSNETSEPQLEFQLSAVEMVGGSSRIPAFKRIIQDVFKMQPSTTLNTDEAVARGCVIHCATLHPGTKVGRNIKILGSEPFSTRVDCDLNHRRVELELITHDMKHVSRTEARNTLEEYIYSERSGLGESDEFKSKLSESLDWLFSDDGEDATEEEYRTKLAELKSLKDSLRVPPESNDTPQKDSNCDGAPQVVSAGDDAPKNGPVREGDPQVTEPCEQNDSCKS